MKSQIKKIMIFFSVASLSVFVLFFSGNREKNNIKKTIVLAHDKGSMPFYQKSFVLQGKRAEKVIGAGFIPEPIQTTDLFSSRMMAALPTKDAPELFTWWSSWRVKELVDKNLVNDLTPLWDKHSKEYASGIRRAYTLNNRVYGFPYTIEYWAVWYNKAIFKRLGLNVPETWKEFISVCEGLKADNIPPILMSLQDQWYSFVWFEEMIFGEDPELYLDLCEGRARYTDPRVKKAMKVWEGMINKQYFTAPSINIFTNTGHLWNNEKFGMMLCGSWIYSTVLLTQGVDVENIGVFILPSHNSSAGNIIAMESGPVFTAKNAVNSQAAEKIVDWWMGPEGSAHFSKQFESYSPNQKTDHDYLPKAKKRLLLDIVEKKCKIMNRYWEATPSPICQVAVKKFEEFILEPTSMERVLLDIENAATRYWEEE